VLIRIGYTLGKWVRNQSTCMYSEKSGIGSFFSSRRKSRNSSSCSVLTNLYVHLYIPFGTNLISFSVFLKEQPQLWLSNPRRPAQPKCLLVCLCAESCLVVQIPLFFVVVPRNTRYCHPERGHVESNSVRDSARQKRVSRRCPRREAAMDRIDWSS
jgi:hypothetical protein